MGCLPQTSISGLMNPTATGRPVNGGRNLTRSDKTEWHSALKLAVSNDIDFLISSDDGALIRLIQFLAHIRPTSSKEESISSLT
jgi:hypothetical protein